MHRSHLFVAALVLAGCTSDPDSDALSKPEGDEAYGALPDIEAALLLNHPYPSLRIEVDYVEGREPAAENLAAFIESVRNLTKKHEVNLDPPQLIEGVEPDPTRSWTREEVQAIHNKSFESDADPDRPGRGTTAYFHILFLNGRVGPVTAGYQSHNYLIVLKDGLFEEGYEAGITRNKELDVLLHEMGHAYGLVNCGIPMTLDREGDRCHSTHDESVMFAGSAEKHVKPSLDNIIRKVTSGEWIPAAYDEYDLADVAAYQAQWDTTE